MPFYTNEVYFDYKYPIGSYLGANSNAVFVCPADDFVLTGEIASWFTDPPAVGQGFYTQTWTDGSSYWFNGGVRADDTNDLGMAEKAIRPGPSTGPHRAREISGGIGLSSRCSSASSAIPRCPECHELCGRPCGGS